MDVNLNDEPEFPTMEEARARLARYAEKKRLERPSISSLKLADELDYAADAKPLQD
ncbi:hypothetical protein D3C71_418550 [compost metagenome]